MTNRTINLLKTIEAMCDSVMGTLNHGSIEVMAVLETTAPLKVLIEHSFSEWIATERNYTDEPEEYFERLKRNAMAEAQEYKDLLTALKGLIASFSEYEAIFTLEPGIELIIDR